MRKIALSLWALVALAATSFAGPFGSTQFYGANGQYQGQALGNGFGGYRFYGSSGQYQGQALGNGFGGYQYYGADGRYLGTSH